MYTPAHTCTCTCRTSWGREMFLLKEKKWIEEDKIGWKQVAGVKHSAFLYPYFTSFLNCLHSCLHTNVYIYVFMLLTCWPEERHNNRQSEKQRIYIERERERERERDGLSWNFWLGMQWIFKALFTQCYLQASPAIAITCILLFACMETARCKLFQLHCSM